MAAASGPLSFLPSLPTMALWAKGHRHTETEWRLAAGAGLRGGSLVSRSPQASAAPCPPPPSVCVWPVVWVKAQTDISLAQLSGRV